MACNCSSSPLRLGVLLSGGGTTMQNLAECIARGELNCKIQCVISSNPKAYGNVRAENLKLPFHLITRKECGTIENFSAKIISTLRQYDVDLVIMAGFLALWTLPAEWLPPHGRVMNIHPALLPKFGGKGMHGHHVHEAVLAAGEKESGCTVHYADNKYDNGPIIVQKRVPVLATDTADTLAARVFEQECIAYPEAIRIHMNALKQC